MEKAQPGQVSVYTILDQAANGNIGYLRDLSREGYVLEQPYGPDYFHETATALEEAHEPDVSKWLARELLVPILPNLTRYDLGGAFSHASFELLKWLQANGAPAPDQEDILGMYVSDLTGGDVDDYYLLGVLDWLKRVGWIEPEGEEDLLLSYSSEMMVNWLADNGASPFGPETVLKLVERGELETLKLLETRGLIEITDYLVKEIRRYYGYQEKIVEWVTRGG